jgi:ribonuclease HI
MTMSPTAAYAECGVPDNECRFLLKHNSTCAGEYCATPLHQTGQELGHWPHEEAARARNMKVIVEACPLRREVDDWVVVHSPAPWMFTLCTRFCPSDGCRVTWYHKNQRIVAVDGACRRNGQVGALAAYGVYWGPSNVLNSFVTLSDNTRVTNQIAELSAATHALDQVLQDLHARGLNSTFRDMTTLIIQTDSAYMVHGITDWIHNWYRNGWTTAKGLQVANAWLFKGLDDKCNELKDAWNIDVLFWQVPRSASRVPMADELANLALDNSCSR